MSVSCESCQRELDEDDVVFQMESADILCEDCGQGVLDALGPDEFAHVRVHLSDVHEDWKR